MPAKGNKCCCGSPPDPWPPGIVVMCDTEELTVPAAMSVVLPGNDNPGHCCALYPGDYTLNYVGLSSSGIVCNAAYESTERTLLPFGCAEGAAHRIRVSLAYYKASGDVQCNINVYGPNPALNPDWSSPTIWSLTIPGNGPNLNRAYSCSHFSGVANCYNSIPATLDATPA